MRITLYGFLQYNPDLFENVVLPDGIEKHYCIEEIIRRSGDLFPYHQDGPYLKRNIENWFNRNFYQFKRMIDAVLAEYNPIENYDRYESNTTTPGVVRTETHSGNDTRDIESKPGSTQTTTNEVSAYDTASYSPHDKSTVIGSGVDTSTDVFKHGETIKHDVTGKDEYTAHMHGNIGVTTNAAMVSEELELRRFDIYTDIARRFEKEFLIQVY